MENVETIISEDGKTLTLRVPLDKPLGRTRGDRGTVLAKTGGFRQITNTPMAFTFMLYAKDTNVQKEAKNPSKDGLSKSKKAA